MKRSTKQLLSLLLAIVMVCGLMAPAMAARPMGGDVAETPVTDVSGAKLSGTSRPAVKGSGQAELLTAGDKKTLDASTMTAFAQGAKADGDTETVDGYFTVHYGAKDKLDSNKKSFDDGYNATQCINFGSYSDFTKQSDYIEFTTTAPTVLKMWWVSNKANRPTNIYKSTDTGTTVWTSGQPGVANALFIDKIYLADSATYYIGFPSSVDNPVTSDSFGGNYIFKVEAIEVEQEPTVTETAWDDVGTLTISAAKAVDADSQPIDNKVDVTVSGVAIGSKEDATTLNTVNGAEKVTVEMYKDGADTAATTKTITKWGDTDASNVVTFDLTGTGVYTFKATATRGQETPKEATAAESISYTLSLAKPSLTANAGNGKVSLSWVAVPEATSYEVYQGDTKLNGEPTLTSGTYYLEVEGLTNDTEYTFTVKALRADPAAEAVSDPATATPKAPEEGGTKVVSKYTLDTTKVLPTSENKTHLTTANLTAVTTVSVDGGAATEGARYFGVTEGTFNDGGTEKAGYVQKRGDATKTKGIEFAKQAGASVDFTVKGTAKATVSYCSTGGSNVSMMALVDGEGKVVTPVMKTAGAITDFTSYIATDSTTAEPKSNQTAEPGVVIAYGNDTTPTTVEYTLTAGKYSIVAYKGFTARDGWVTGSVEVEDTVEVKPVTKEYTLDTTKVLPTSENKTHLTTANLTAVTTVSVDGGAATEGARYFGVTEGTFNDGGTEKAGYVQKRGDATKTKGIEFAKQAGASVDFTVKGTAKATVSYCSTGGSNVSMMALVDGEGKVVTPVMKTAGAITDFTSYIATDSTTAEPKSNQTAEPGVVIAYGNDTTPTTVEYTLTAGKYSIVAYKGFTARDGWVTGSVIVSDTFVDTGDLEENVVDWTVDAICGTPTYTATVSGDKINVTVTGPKVGAEEDGSAINIYADGLSIVMINADGEEVASVEDNAEGDSHKATFTPTASGKYTFAARVSRADEDDLTAAASDPVEFTLALATPAINSVSSNGLESGKDTASVTVSWSSVPEASSYNLYVRAKAAEGAEAAAWGDAIVVPAAEGANVNVVVTDLTVGAEYEFTVEAVRAATTIGGVSIPASTTAKSDVADVLVVANKQIPWVAKVFGTSASADYNSIIEGDYKTDFSVVTNGAKPVESGGKYTDENGQQWDKQPEYAPGTQHVEEFKGLTGDLNTDPEGRILLSSREGAGKITEPTGSDGLLFYYTTVPAGYNFYIRAKVHVTRWFTRDTQNGLGLAVLDRVPAESQSGSTGSNGGDYWNNSYMAGAARLSFRWDADNGKAYASDDPGASSFTNYSYYMGLCSIVKHGRPAGYSAAGAEPATFQTRRFPLDTALPRNGVSAKYGTNTNRFNTIGNFAALPAGFSTMSENGDIMKNYEMTDFILEIRKTPTGYISTYWAPDADPEKDEPLGQNIEYYSKGAPELSGGNPYTHYEGAVGAENAVDQSGNSELGLTNMDESAEYVGLFTSRDTDALFTNVKFDMWPQSEDETPVQTPPVTTLKPNVTISSGDSSNSPDFTLSVMANVDGWITIKQDGSVIASELPVKAEERQDVPVTLKTGNNRFEVSLKVDTDMELPAYTVLDLSEPPKDAVSNVTYSTRFANLTNIFVSPNGNSTGRGTRTSPVDVHTAVAAVRAGQNIILLGGEYKLTKTIRISRGMDGTEAQPIYFVADPANTEPVVLNGQRSAGGIIVHGGNWWVFKGFEVVGSSNGATAFAVSGNNNIVQDVKIHDNGGTGLSITRLNSSVKVPTRPTPNSPASEVTDWGEWPCNNLILNCEAYRNYDLGYGGADGFTAKLTVGEGNVFDGCAAYWNADDGWDLFAKSSDEEGPIGVVTIKNSIAFQNGYEVRKIVNTTTQTPEYEADGYTAVMDLNDDGTVNFKTAGNGNGFKMGGNHLPGAHEIYNSYSFYNHAKGFDSNNGPDVTVSGCTSYNNGDENIGLSSNADKSYKVNKVVSFKDDKAPEGAEGKKGMADGIGGGNGSNTGNVIDTATYYAWDGTKSSNGTTELTADNFASLDFDALVWAEGGAERKADGSLDLGDFLKLVNVSDAGAGDLVNDTTPVEDPENVKNPPEEGSTDTPTSGGNGGTIGGGNDKPDDNNKPEETPVYTAKKTTNTAGDTEIVVTDQTGDTVADVKIPATIPSSDVKFDDAIGHWAEDSIDNMAALGVVNGVGNNLYGVDDDVTRGALATMLFRFANGKEGVANTFADVASNEWYTDAIGWAVKVGVVTGYSTEAFGPNDNITREQMAVMLARFAKLVGLDTTASASELADFQDVSAVDSWAVDGMAWCVKNGIIKGVSADTLSPDTHATRAQTAVMLDRFIQLMK